MWLRTVVLCCFVAAPAFAQETTVYFGVPAEVMEIVEVAPEVCPGSVTIERSFEGRRESMAMALLDCSRQPRPEAVRALSVLARPRTMDAPSEEGLSAFDADPEFVAEGIRRVHPALLERLTRIADAFPGRTIEIQSGYRPEAPASSRHHHARALDLMVIGVPREEVRDLARSFDETGVGWYPNSTFVHVDVREESEYWVDESRPGEAPRYVAAQEPPVDFDAIRRETADMLRELRVDGP